jgi:glyoxylase-like metal-dependent hydrolase (beta-lactamase superfamily II)
MTSSLKSFSRRSFLAATTSAGAMYAANALAPLAALAQSPSLANDPRISQQPIVDKGFALVRKVGDGVYATISDRTKGMQTRSNGGFVVGRDSAVLIEGFQTPIGASFQFETLRSVTQVPIQAALNTHWHFDHTLGNTYYGGAGIPVWAHADAAVRMTSCFLRFQKEDLARFVAPFEKRVKEAKTDTQRQHAQSDIEGVSSLYTFAMQSVLGVPSRPLDPAKMPMKIDLGGLTIVVEFYVGHTDTDLIFRIPERNVVYAGDLLVYGQYPTNINGYPTKWRANVAKFAKFDKDTIFVPGHGQVCGQEAVTLMLELFDDMADQAQKLYKAGVPVEEATERYVVPAKWKDMRQFSWGFCVGRTIEQHYAEWSGKPGPVLNY